MIALRECGHPFIAREGEPLKPQGECRLCSLIGMQSGDVRDDADESAKDWRARDARIWARATAPGERKQ